MGAARIELRSEARAELVTAALWFAERDLDTAIRFMRAIDERLDRLREFPKSGEPFLNGTRRIQIRGWPYQIIYRTVEDYFEVLAVSNVNRDQSYWRERL